MAGCGSREREGVMSSAGTRCGGLALALAATRCAALGLWAKTRGGGLALALAATVSAVLALWTTAAVAHPFRGSVLWSLVLCRFSDSPPPTRSVADYERLFFEPGAGGAADYWNAVSYGG